MGLSDFEKNHQYRRGQWEGFNRILNLLNTFDTKMIDKTKLYIEIMKMRPNDDKNCV